MELANSVTCRVRQATRYDSAAIGRFLTVAPLRHLHTDWHLPVDWLGTPGFVLCEKDRPGSEAEIAACLAVGIDPPPAAWVRVAAVRRDGDAEWWLQEMLDSVVPYLGENGVTLLGWLAEATWPETWLTRLGFQRVNSIVTYSRELGSPEPVDEALVSIRQATEADTARLAEIEQGAFEPLWRHSQRGLLAALKEAILFDVAEMDGRIVGFQYSVDGHDGESAHLVRLTVAAEAQGRGVGRSLLQAALEGYRALGLERVTLNTQEDNHASHRLYERFAFRQLAGRVAVWALPISEPSVGMERGH
jgi:ribosomal protein S18 acetylase RimI-like enzyme